MCEPLSIPYSCHDSLKMLECIWRWWSARGTIPALSCPRGFQTTDDRCHLAPRRAPQYPTVGVWFFARLGEKPYAMKLGRAIPKAILQRRDGLAGWIHQVHRTA